jgi:hypothetical protein
LIPVNNGVIGNIVSNNVIGCLLIRHSVLITGNLTVKDFVNSIFQIVITVSALSLLTTTAQQITQYTNKVIPKNGKSELPGESRVDLDSSAVDGSS